VLWKLFSSVIVFRFMSFCPDCPPGAVVNQKARMPALRPTCGLFPRSSIGGAFRAVYRPAGRVELWRLQYAAELRPIAGRPGFGPWVADDDPHTLTVCPGGVDAPLVVGLDVP